MIADLARQQGFLAAHGIWCVSDGGPLIPFVGVRRADGEQELVRFVDEEDYGRGVERARAFLLAGAQGASFASLVYDGFVTLPDGKTDALVIEGRVHAAPAITLTQVVPYRSVEHARGFAVHRPKLVDVSGPYRPDEAVLKAFWEGVDAHEKGAEVWSRHLDESR